MSEPLLIMGASGNARQTYAVALAMNENSPDDPPWELLGFVDDGQPDLAPIERLGARVVGTSASLPNFSGAHYCLGVGGAQVKRSLAKRADAAGLSPGTLIHPTAVIDPDVEIGPGSVVGRLTVLATNVRVGQHTTVATQSSVAHDCCIGDFAFVAQGAILAGGVEVGDDVFLGAASSFRQGVAVGDGVTVGLGAVVVTDLPPGCVAAGIPARPMKQAV